MKPTSYTMGGHSPGPGGLPPHKSHGPQETKSNPHGPEEWAILVHCKNLFLN